MVFFFCRKGLVVKRMSPNSQKDNLETSKGLFLLLCSERRYRLTKSLSSWDFKKMEPAFFHIAKLKWRFDAISNFFRLSYSQVSRFITEETSSGKQRWTLKGMIKLMDAACFIIEVKGGEVVSYDSATDSLFDCMESVVSIANYSEDKYHLSSVDVNELLQFNYFNKINEIRYKEYFFEDKYKDPELLLTLFKALETKSLLSDGRSPLEMFQAL